MAYLNQQSARMIGPPMAIYHDGEFRERDWDIEVCMPIVDEMTPDEQLRVYSVPGFAAACVVHASFATIAEARRHRQ
jgi:effector-binding domain-containing protein